MEGVLYTGSSLSHVLNIIIQMYLTDHIVPFVSLHLWRFSLVAIISFYALIYLVLDVDRKKRKNVDRMSRKWSVFDGHDSITKYVAVVCVL